MPCFLIESNSPRRSPLPTQAHQASHRRVAPTHRSPLRLPNGRNTPRLAGFGDRRRQIGGPKGGTRCARRRRRFETSSRSLGVLSVQHVECCQTTTRNPLARSHMTIQPPAAADLQPDTSKFGSTGENARAPKCGQRRRQQLTRGDLPTCPLCGLGFEDESGKANEEFASTLMVRLQRGHSDETYIPLIARSILAAP